MKIPALMPRGRGALLASAAIGCSLVLAIGCGSSQKTKEASTETTGGNTSTAPSGQAAANQKEALVRFINGLPGESASLSLGGQTAFSNIGYSDATPYQPFAADRKGFALFTGTGAGNAPPIASESKGLDAGGHYTVVAALDDQGKPKLDVVDDNLTPPQNGKANVRVINASADEVNVFAPESRQHSGKNSGTKAEKLFSGVNQASAAGYKDVDPFQGTINIQRDVSGGGMAGGTSSGAEPKHVARVVQLPVDFQAGKDYTIVTTGGTATSPLKARVIEDQLNGVPGQGQ